MFKEVAEVAVRKFADSSLGKMSEGKTLEGKPMSEYDKPLDVRQPEYSRFELIQNKQEGMRREKETKTDLQDQYPESEGNIVLEEVYLRDKDGNIVKDPVTGEARRIDFVVVDGAGNVVDSVEVTSKTADKTDQTAKENRIRENGGNYVKMPDGSLVKIPDSVTTRIDRRD